MGAAILASLALAVFLAFRWMVSAKQSKQLSATLEGLKSSSARRIAELGEQIAALNAKVSRLAKWEVVADADDAASRLLHEARQEAERLTNEAAANLREAQGAAAEIKRLAEAEAISIRQEARNRASKAVAEADARVADADAKASAIVSVANKKAEEIAGDALRALREAKDLERTVRSLQNIIEGYGDRYIIPTHTILDDLAEGFGHTEAGQKLKFARERVREAVKTGKAATCAYVEDNRRETAIRFVTDAFNGKVDSILAKVRHDNIGTLTQELLDAFAVVNHNGKAFRDARITDDYLALRQDELHWAVVATELKEQEREEQRRLKEKLREEEKARKDFERAIKESAREEEIVRKAVEKTQLQLAAATDEQKAKYEAQLQELQGRLEEAEKRNQRALSMAQQTRRGHVYVISNVGSFGEHVYKIGLTRRLDPLDRIRELGDSSVPFDFDVHALIFSEDAPALESQLHRHFLLRQVNKVDHRKEFFRVSIADIRQEMESLTLSASWTMAAAAREYHESLAIEKLIADDPKAREAWVKRQLLLELPETDSLDASAGETASAA